MRARPRIQDAGLIYHVTSRGTRRAEIYRSDADRHHFLRFVDRACGVDGLICHAYCLMGNHYHLLVEAPAGNLSVAMHRINSGFAKHFNLEHNVEGHVFERRYRSWVMGGEARAMEALRYVVRNPVRAGICATPEDWPWSSHAATAGIAPRPNFLTVGTVHGWFGATVPTVRKFGRGAMRRSLHGSTMASPRESHKCPLAPDCGRRTAMPPSRAPSPPMTHDR